jgi:hypothetical protein
VVISRGTGSSNPSPSSGESCANHGLRGDVRERFASHQESASPLLDKRGKGRVELALTACIQDQQAHAEIMCRDL